MESLSTICEIGQYSLKCRLCLSENENLYPIFKYGEVEVQAVPLHVQVAMCTTVQVSKYDKLPNRICMNCRNFVCEWYTFRLKCIRSNAFLKNHQHVNEETPQNLPAKSALDYITFSNDPTLTKADDNNKRMISIEIEEVANENKTWTDLKVRYKCKRCPDSFYEHNDLLNHDQIVHCKEGSAVEQPLVKNTIKMASKGVTKPRYQKRCCDKLFLSRSLYRYHICNKHPGDKHYNCDVCGKRNFISEETLKRHKLLHTGRYGCKVCGRTFTCHASLRIHERDKHENDRPFVCDVCGKAFVTELRLNYHQRFHTGEKKYICEECGVAVVTSSSLAKHKRIHSKVKPHVCHLCGKGFIVRGRLLEHIRMHTGDRPYICDVCSKAFTMLDKLRRHTKTHSNEKAFSCEICGNAYTTNHGLSVHRKSHTIRQQELPNWASYPHVHHELSKESAA